MLRFPIALASNSTWKYKFVKSYLLSTIFSISVLASAIVVFLGGGGGGFRPFTLEKIISSEELERKARTRPDIFRVVLGPYL